MFKTIAEKKKIGATIARQSDKTDRYNTKTQNSVKYISHAATETIVSSQLLLRSRRVVCSQPKNNLPAKSKKASGRGPHKKSAPSGQVRSPTSIT